MKLLETTHLLIRRIRADDAAFILVLLNEASFIENIGDKQVRTLADALNYIKTGPQQMYKDFGFALHIVCLKNSNKPIGMCGLLKRDTLPEPDIGFAFLEQYSGKGYGYESAKAVLDYEVQDKQLKTVLAITAINNPASRALLFKLGFVFDKQVQLAGMEKDSNLYQYCN
ncbi:GNAT family N-acetyltransferase [Thalassotalea psychrophila]|uniref:GNAT family N-acetyltransferase n=1 Tax=Thalassotalea psychrophila TaxID=3065647 RepID=A0ABY9U164_9GAMM|nr:GNAT family N-acetyltransferase [Colwelliaceae bacterium SQ149]